MLLSVKIYSRASRRGRNFSAIALAFIFASKGDQANASFSNYSIFDDRTYPDDDTLTSIFTHFHDEYDSQEIVEEIKEITLGIASEEYDGNVYDTPEVEIMHDTVEDPSAFPVIEDMPNILKKPKKNHTVAGLHQEEAPFYKDETKKFPVVIKYKKKKKEKILELLVGKNQSTQSVSLRNEISRLNIIATSVTNRQLKKLQRSRKVIYVAPDREIFPVRPETNHQEQTRGSLNETSSIQGASQHVPYGLRMVKSDKVPIHGRGIKVCVLDEGYDYTHQDLPDDVEWITSKSIDATDNLCSETEFCSGHGTHVSGTISAKHNNLGIVGIASLAKLVEGAYLNTRVYESSYLAAIQTCVDKGARVVNMSFGSCPRVITDQNRCSRGWRKHIQDTLRDFVNNENVLLIAAAGNHGDTIDSNGPSYPASYDAVISVASVNSRGRRSRFSAQNGPDISAPGSSVLSTVPGNRYGEFSGTSMASPHVAGVAALVMSAMPWLSATQVRDHLFSFASDIGFQANTGNGLVDPGFFPIALKQSGKCLDHKGATYKGGVHLWNCHNGHQQMWAYDKQNKHLVTSTGLCLDYSQSKGLSVYPCIRNENQKFSYNYSQHSFTAHGKCLHARTRTYYQNGGTIWMYHCHYRPNQQWYLGSDIHSKVNLCQHSNCNDGGQLWASFGNFPAMPSQIGNDELTRALIYKNVYFHYFESTSFRGWNLVFGPWVNLYMGGHNNSVSSFKIGLVPEGKVRLCRHSNCAGGDYYASVGDWRYMPSSVGNDQLTRVHIPRGLKFTYFEDTKLRGWSRTFGSCNHGINLYMGGHNDAVSSFRVLVCYD